MPLQMYAISGWLQVQGGNRASGSILQTGVYQDYRQEHAMIVLMVILCHCNVHPSCLLAVIVVGALASGEQPGMGQVASNRNGHQRSRTI